jgi:DNA replication and repair protein RecF
MQLHSLSLQQVRCISTLDILTSSRFNLFVGQNGCGKTSILEAIHILGLGRSFRHTQLPTVIQHGKDFLRVVGALTNEKDEKSHFLGIQKNKEGKPIIHIDQAAVSSVAKLAAYLPLQLIHPDSDELITGGSALRRQYMDWGVFHVEHAFYEAWKTFHRLLKQRNAALKAHASRDEILAWDELYIPTAIAVSHYRETYIAQLKPYFQSMLSPLTRLPPVEIIFEKGWPEGVLFDLLAAHYPRDSHSGHTSLGPHRDELKILVEGHQASSMLSRGEQKLVMTALKLAQAAFLKNEAKKTCLFLLDDFAAELDAEHRYQVIQSLSTLESQVFLTSIHLEEVQEAFGGLEMEVFHVEHLL